MKSSGKNLGVYILAAGLMLAIAALGIAAVVMTSGLPKPAMGAAKYILAGGGVMLAGVIALFIWLARRGK